MTYTLRLRVQARQDFLEALDWYVEEDVRVAERFTAAIDDVLDEVREHPLKYARIRGQVRRAMAKAFPYGVFFRVREDEIIVLAILHLARDPSIWKSRR